MELNANACRSVEFREKRYGYHPADVDVFLEELAVAIEAHLTKTSAVAAASAAALSAAQAAVNDDSIGRTLLLAQRSADTAIRDAEQQAQQIVVDAHEQARQIVANATWSSEKIT